MARKPNHQFEKRQRERARAERAAARRERKQQRAEDAESSSPTTLHDDPDLAGIVPGPQRQEVVTDEELRRVVEHAMNPGRQFAGDEPRAGQTSKVFVGNLDFAATESDLQGVFTSEGFEVADAVIVCDRDTGQPRGFAFVELVGFKEAARAAREVDGIELGGRPLRVSVAEGR